MEDTCIYVDAGSATMPMVCQLLNSSWGNKGYVFECVSTFSVHVVHLYEQISALYVHAKDFNILLEVFEW